MQIRAEVANDAATALAASTTLAPTRFGISRSLANRPPSCTPPPVHALALSQQMEGSEFADVNVEASSDEDDDYAQLDTDSGHGDKDQGGEAISNITPSPASLPLQTPMLENPNLSRNNRRREDDRVCFGEDFSQSASDRDDEAYNVGDRDVSSFYITPPPSQRRGVSIDPHEMHASHVMFWNSGIREEFANRHSHSQQFMHSDQGSRPLDISSPYQSSMHNSHWMSIAKV